jgi:predicted  nucleic acid-binding Zn-ribbon protein
VLKVQLKKTEEHLKKTRAEHAQKKQQIEADLDRYVQEIEAQKAARLELVAAITPEVLSNYDRLREAKNGLAVVITKYELCMGCNMKIPPQSYNQVITSNEIIYCPNCRRMLYITGEPEQTESTGREARQ